MSAIRVLFLVMGSVVGLGIWLSGWNQVHWVLYLPAIGLVVAAITGICPGYMIFKKLGFGGGAEGLKG